MGLFGIDLMSHAWAIVYCGVSSLGALCFGYDQIYYTGVLGMGAFARDYGTTTDADGNPALTTSFISVTTSMIYVGDLIGAIAAAPINERFGRKAVFYLACICIIIGALMQILANSREGLIIAGRIFIGLGIGQFTVTCLLYIGEVAPVAVRGPALMMFQFLQSCSQLVGSGITEGTSSITNSNAYLIPMGLLIALPGIMLLLLPFTPESPTFFALRGDCQGAERALRKTNSSNSKYDPTNDLKVLDETCRKQRHHDAVSSWASLLTDRIERRKLICSSGAMVAQQINGVMFFYSYGVLYARSLGMENPFLIQLITNVLQVVAVGVSVLLGNKIPRRINLMICSIGMFISLLIVGGLGTKKNLDHGVDIAIVIFSYLVIVFFNFSLGPLSFTIASETAVGRNRNKLMSCSIAAFFITVWVIAFTAPYLYYDAELGPMVCFIYAGLACVTLAHVWYCVGETKGRTSLEIERFFDEHVPVRQWRDHKFANSPSSSSETVVEESEREGRKEVSV